MPTNTNLNLNNTISSSKYDIYTKLLDLYATSNYSAGQDIGNIDFLKAGLFGYVTESMAMIMRDSSYHKSMIYKENFLNTAILPRSVYNWAKLFNVNCIDARPSSRNAIFTISTDDINNGINAISNNISTYQEKYGITENGSFIVLDKFNPIIAGDFYFSLEHSIEIYRNARGSYIIKYCLNELDKTTEFGEYPSAIIPYQIKTVNDKTYIEFKARVFQYRVVESSKIISGSSFLDVKKHSFTYNGQLCGLSLTYSKNNVEQNVDLKFSNITIEDDVNSKTMSAYYSLEDENTVEILFNSNQNGGLPQAGGTLTLRTFITNGSSGNINFTGDAIFLISQEDFKTLSINVKLDSTILTSGIDASDLQNIKSTIVNRLSLRNTIVTENDLNIWFENQAKLLENVNNSIITFRKEKDNLIKRTFAAYLLLRDGVELSAYMDIADTETSDNSYSSSDTYKAASSYISNVIPTNTIDVVYNVNDISDGTTSKYFEIVPQTQIKYNSTTGQYLYGGTDSSNTDFIYVSPFYIYINPTYNLVSYIYADTDSSTTINYQEIRELSNISLTPLSAELIHDSSVEGSGFRLRYYFNSDVDLSTITINNASLRVNNNIVLNFNNSINFVSETTTDTESSENKNYYIDIILNIAEGSLFSFNSENAYINLTYGTSASATSFPEKISAVLTISGQNSDNTSAFDIDVATDNQLTVFSALGDIMSSDLVVNKNENNEITSYTIKAVPVVADYWYNSSINKDWFIKQLYVFINMLKENSDKLETTTFFNIKFRNTYGISHYYNSLYSNIRLDLTVYLKNDAINSYNGIYVNATSIQEALENEIRDYIRVVVDNANEDETFTLSKIIMRVQAAYINYIDHIDFNGLNGTFNQYINKINTTDVSSPLEYINLDNTFSTSTNSRIKSDIKFEII